MFFFFFSNMIISVHVKIVFSIFPAYWEQDTSLLRSCCLLTLKKLIKTIDIYILFLYIYTHTYRIAAWTVKYINIHRRQIYRSLCLPISIPKRPAECSAAPAELRFAYTVSSRSQMKQNNTMQCNSSFRANYSFLL